jgi:tryptophan halogenase
MSALYKLLEHFPDRSFASVNIDSYNRELIEEMESIRDFIILHYCLTMREDTPFWTYCRTMKLPDSLSQRIELYRHAGRIRPTPRELFTDMSWFYIFEGMGVTPERYDPLLDIVSAEQLRDLLGNLAQSVAALTAAAPSHDSYFHTASPRAAASAARATTQ